MTFLSWYFQSLVVWAENMDSDPEMAYSVDSLEMEWISTRKLQ